MRPWEIYTREPTPKTPPVPRETLNGFAFVFDEDDAFWKAYGQRAPNVFQFEIGDESTPERWFIELDENGARVGEGLHTEPTVIWRSSGAAFSRAFSGEYDDDDPVYISGGLAPLQDLLRAIAQA